MYRRACTTLLFLLLLAFSTLSRAAGLVELSDLIAELQSQGYTIVYSNSFVHRGMRVEVDEPTIEGLQQLLPGFGLRLEQSGAIWLVVEGEPVADQVGEPAAPDAASLLENVIVTGSLYRYQQMESSGSSRRMSAEDMQLEPNLASDALRVSTRLPGVSSVGISAKPRIRGGLQDELLVIQDGVELLEPFHLADYHSAYSAIDYLTIESIDIYTGGFPSRYGNRMSGVMDISNQWASEDYDTDIGVSSFSTFIHTRGEFGERTPMKWLLSARQGDLSDLTDYLQSESGNPEYRDAAARFSVDFNERKQLSGGVQYGDDDVNFGDAEENASSNVDSVYVWARYDRRYNEKLRSSLSASWVDFQRKRSQFSPFEEDKGGFLDHDQDVERLALRNDYSALWGNSLLEFGWQADYGEAHYRHRSLIDRGELAHIIGTEQEVNRDINLKPDGFSGGVYLAGEFDLSDKLTVQPSVRWDVQDYYLDMGKKEQFSPRIGILYQFSDRLRGRLNLGRFYQPEALQELQVLDGEVEFFRPQSSDQLVVGVEYESKRITATAEFYYKEYHDQKRRYENMFNPFVLLPELEPDRVALEPDKAEAMGVDLELRYRLGDSLSGWVRYSYMDADDRINGEWVPRRWSQSNTAHLALLWQRGEFSLSTSLAWHNGWRSSKLPPVVPPDTVIPTESVLNNAHLRDFYSVDLSARYAWTLGPTRLQIFADISNVLDRKNVAGIDYDLQDIEQGPLSGGFRLIPDRETLLGRVPSVGIILSF